MLKKLSLAALIAMGSMSVASATPLTEAIKGVNLSGFLRVRLYNENYKNATSYNRWRTNAVLIFGVPVSENIKFVMRNSVQTNVYTNSTALNPDGTTSSAVDDNIVNNLLFMQYSKDNLTVNLGKIPVPTSITSADPATPGHGAGAIALYKVNNNLTLAGAYVDALKNPGNNTGVDALNVIGNDIYAAAAVFNTGMVSGNVWYYHAVDLVDSIVTASVDVKPVKNVDVHADFATGKLDSKTGLTTDNHTYFNVSAKYSKDGFCAKVGYAATNKKGAIVELSADAPIGAVLPTANRYNIANMLDTKAMYAKLGYQVDPKTNVYAAYTNINQGADYGNADSNEYKVGASYAYTKKLGFDLYYDYLDYSKSAGDNDQTEVRFQALYKF